MTFTINPAPSEAIRKIGGVSEAVTLSRGGSNENYSFVVVDSEKIDFDKSAAMETQNKSARIWEMVFDRTYGKTAADGEGADGENDFTGWISVYGNRPIPVVEMNAWRDGAVERIKKLKPRSLLEIGCGTGLLLWKLHQDLEKYLGVDPSESAVRQLTQRLRNKGIAHVRVLKDTAAGLTRYAREPFDTIVLNSVIQYFPGTQYLRGVIEDALKTSCDSLYVGDVKSLRHESIFQSSVALSQADGGESARSCHSMPNVQGNELSGSEEFFERLAGDEYALEILVKREGFRNEMCRYRYDVIFHRSSQTVPMQPDITASFTSAADLEELIRDHPSATVEVLSIPNARVIADAWAFDHAAGFDGSVEDLLRMSDAAKIHAVDPAELYDLGDRLSMNTRVEFSRTDLSRVNALFEPMSEAFRPWRPERGVTYPYFANNLAMTSERLLIAQYLADQLARLQVCDVPVRIMVVDQMPLREGKLAIERLVELISAE